MTSLTLDLPEDVVERLEDLARRTGHSQTYHAVEAICQYIEDLDDVSISEARLRELRLGKTKPLSLDEIISNHGVDP